MMAEAACLAAVKKTLECSICLQIYNLRDHLPQNLKCGHSFCKSCIDGLIGDESHVTCPKCRREALVSDIVTNFGITDVLDALCEVCTGQNREGTCPHCKQMLCLTCLETHAVIYHKELMTNLDSLEVLIQSAANVSSDSSCLSEIEKKADVTMKKIKETVDEWRKELDMLEKELEDKAKRLHEININKCKAWSEKIDGQVTKAKQFCLTSRTTLGDGCTQESTMSVMSDINDDYQDYSNNLQLMKDTQPDVTDYDFTAHLSVGNVTLGDITVAEPHKAIALYKSPQPQAHSAHIYRTARFKCMTGQFGSSPEDFNHPTFVACMDDRIIVTDTDNHRIKVYDHSLHLMHIQGNPGHNPYQFDEPWGVTITHDQKIIVSDARNNRIKIITKYCDNIKVFGKYGRSYTQYSGPTGLTVAKDDKIYVCECHSHRIKAITGDGTVVWNFGTTGLGALVNYPHDVALHKDRLLVSEKGYPLLKVYSVTGEYITSYPESVTDLPVSGTIQPTGIAVDHNDNIIFADQKQGQLIVLNKDGEFVCTIGTYGHEPGQFDYPHGVAITSKGDIVVCDRNNHRVQIFETD